MASPERERSKASPSLFQPDDGSSDASGVTPLPSLPTDAPFLSMDTKRESLEPPTLSMWKEACSKDKEISLLTVALQDSGTKASYESSNFLLPYHDLIENNQLKLDGDGLIFFEETNGNSSRASRLQIVPSSLRDHIILMLLHSSSSAGHIMGPYNLYLRIRQRFYWPNMWKDVNEWWGQHGNLYCTEELSNTAAPVEEGIDRSNFGALEGEAFDVTKEDANMESPSERESPVDTDQDDIALDTTKDTTLEKLVENVLKNDEESVGSVRTPPRLERVSTPRKKSKIWVPKIGSPRRKKTREVSTPAQTPDRPGIKRNLSFKIFRNLSFQTPERPVAKKASIVSTPDTSTTTPPQTPPVTKKTSHKVLRNFSSSRTPDERPVSPAATVPQTPGAPLTKKNSYSKILRQISFDLKNIYDRKSRYKASTMEAICMHEEDIPTKQTTRVSDCPEIEDNEDVIPLGKWTGTEGEEDLSFSEEEYSESCGVEDEVEEEEEGESVIDARQKSCIECHIEGFFVDDLSYFWKVLTTEDDKSKDDVEV